MRVILISSVSHKTADFIWFTRARSTVLFKLRINAGEKVEFNSKLEEFCEGGKWAALNRFNYIKNK